MAVDAPLTPKHLIKNSTRIPAELEEWSTNLDMEELEPALRKLSSRVGAGFGRSETSEIIAVVEDMKVEQTRAFRFPIKFENKKADLFVEIFTDDLNSPDVAIYSDPALIKCLV